MWQFVLVTELRDIEFSTTAFDHLVIAQEQKDLISSLIKRPEVESSTFDDLIEGKGRGLIFLLHGPPGVGKTFTAGQFTV
jgi:SpoVK/Ycf46/Vps4 family AAA+-type ATPase